MRDHGIDIFNLDGSLLLSMDLTQEATYRLPSTVTDDPVDSGLPSSSHVNPENPDLTYTGIITETPLWDAALYVGLDRRTIAKRIFEALHKAGQLVRIVDVLDVYEPYAFADIVLTRSGDLGRAMQVQLTFKHYNIVSEEVVAVDPSILAGLKKRSRKRKAPKEPTDKQKEAASKAKAAPYNWAGEMIGITKKTNSFDDAGSQMKKTWLGRIGS